MSDCKWQLKLGPGSWGMVKPASQADSALRSLRDSWPGPRSGSCPSPANAWLQVATQTGHRLLRHGQACLTDSLRSLRDSRLCSGSHITSQGRAWLRWRLATWTGATPMTSENWNLQTWIGSVSALISLVNSLVKRKFLKSCISEHMISHVKS